MPGHAYDAITQQPLNMVVPDKTRCGSLDPLEMDKDKKCNCWQTSGEGSCKQFLCHVFIKTSLKS